MRPCHNRACIWRIYIRQMEGFEAHPGAPPHRFQWFLRCIITFYGGPGAPGCGSEPSIYTPNAISIVARFQSRVSGPWSRGRTIRWSGANNPLERGRTIRWVLTNHIGWVSGTLAPSSNLYYLFLRFTFGRGNLKSDVPRTCHIRGFKRKRTCHGRASQVPPESTGLNSRPVHFRVDGS